MFNYFNCIFKKIEDFILTLITLFIMEDTGNILANIAIRKIDNPHNRGCIEIITNMSVRKIVKPVDNDLLNINSINNDINVLISLNGNKSLYIYPIYLVSFEITRPNFSACFICSNNLQI